MGLTTDELLKPSTEILSETIAFEEWFNQFSNECGSLCRQNISVLYRKNLPVEKIAQAQFNEFYQAIIKKAQNFCQSVAALQNSPEELREQRKLLEKIIMGSTSAFVQCLQKYLQVFRKPLPVAITTGDWPTRNIYEQLLDLLQMRNQIRNQLDPSFIEVSIKEMADDFKKHTEMYLDSFETPNNTFTLDYFKATLIQNSKKHIQSFEKKVKILQEKHIDFYKPAQKNTKNYLQTFSKLKFWPRFSEIPLVKKYTKEIHTVKAQGETLETLQNKVKKNFSETMLNKYTFGEKILMIIDIKRQNNALEKNQWIQNIKGIMVQKTAITAEEWKWLNRELENKLMVKMKASTLTPAQFLNDKIFDEHIKKALNTLFEELLPQALLKKQR